MKLLSQAKGEGLHRLEKCIKNFLKEQHKLDAPVDVYRQEYECKLFTSGKNGEKKSMKDIKWARLTLAEQAMALIALGIFGLCLVGWIAQVLNLPFSLKP